jgi:PhnB protein
MPGTHTAPYVNFQGRAREAFEFYHQIFGGELSLFAFDQSGSVKPAGPADPIGHGRLEADAVRLYGSDGNPSYPPTVGDNIAITLTGSDKAALSTAFDSLAEGGRINMPLTEAPWGTAGWLRDRFGVNWNVDIANETDSA